MSPRLKLPQAYYNHKNISTREPWQILFQITTITWSFREDSKGMLKTWSNKWSEYNDWNISRGTPNGTSFLLGPILFSGYHNYSIRFPIFSFKSIYNNYYSLGRGRGTYPCFSSQSNLKLLDGPHQNWFDITEFWWFSLFNYL